MKNKRQKLYRYIAIIIVPFIIGLLSYPFHKNEEFKLFQSLKDKKEFEFYHQDIERLLEQIKNNPIHLNFDITDKDEKKIQVYLDFNQVKFYNDHHHAVFIDARLAYEINDEKIDDSNKVIPNAINIPVEDIDVIRNEGYFDGDMDLEIVEMDFSKEWKTVKYLESLPKDIPYIIYCGFSECDKSKDLADYMIKNFNFKNISVYKGGWEDWKKNL